MNKTSLWGTSVLVASVILILISVGFSVDSFALAVSVGLTVLGAGYSVRWDLHRRLRAILALCVAGSALILWLAFAVASVLPSILAAIIAGSVVYFSRTVHDRTAIGDGVAGD